MLEDEFYIFQLKNKNAIFSYNTAMYLFRASERTPDKIDVTVYMIKNAKSLKDKARNYKTRRILWWLPI